MLFNDCFYLLIICFVFVNSHHQIPYHDICGVTNGRRMYLELGDKGFISAKNITSNINQHQPILNKINITNLVDSSSSSYNQCTLELITCPFCVITVNFSYMNINQTCTSNQNSIFETFCRCDYVWISEPSYENVSSKRYCGNQHEQSPTSIYYRSQTRSITITYFYNASSKHAFSLKFHAERNREFFKGAPIEIKSNFPNNNSNSILISPFFPKIYPRDLISEYIISCEPSLSVKCYIRLIFTDFQLGTMSFIEFFDWNGERITVTTGALFRPPVIVTTGPSLLVRFHANSGIGLGFKAYYKFISNKNDISTYPITDCGGFVENLGGAITMMNMVNNGLQSYDCIWLIKPPKNYLMKSHIYIKVVTFQNMGTNSDIIIREGLTSDRDIIEHIMYRQTDRTDLLSFSEHIASINIGFYINLRGIFTPQSRLAIVYNAFSYKECFTGSDFFCNNHRCIPTYLSCDSFDHCGDNSDEPPTCYRDWESEQIDRRWYSHTPNYYFPRIEPYTDLKMATLIFIISSLGLIGLISALIFLLYRLGSRSRQQRELQDQLQTISDLLEVNRNEEVITIPDDPPDYEAPPGYDEIIKVGLNDTATAHKRRAKKRRNGQSRSRSLSNRRRSKSKRNVEDDSTLQGESTPVHSGSLCLPFLSNSNKHFELIASNSSSPPQYLQNIDLNGYQTMTNRNHIKSISANNKKSMNQLTGEETPRTLSLIRRCRSQDDLLKNIRIVITTDNINGNNQNQTVSDSHLPSERDKFRNIASGHSPPKDYKTMKSYIEDLFVRATHPRKNYTQVICNCGGACSCAVMNSRRNNNENCNTGYEVFNVEQYIPLNGNSETLTSSSPNSSRSNGHARIRSVDDTLLSKSYLYLSNLKIWKSAENNL